MQELVSIVIPVYNVEKYLDRCLSSVIEQSYKNIEIIIVNDGSTDNSLNICESYKERDKRIKIFSKVNGGLSSARNLGTDKANGVYLAYIDSDDYVTNDYINNLYIAIKENNSDISISSFLLVDEESKYSKKNSKSSVTKISCYTPKEAIKELLLQKKFDTSAWGKMYTRDIYTKIIYPQGKLFEDLPVTYKLFLNCSSISFINSDDYFYVQRKESIINTQFNNEKLILLEWIEDLEQNILKKYPDLTNYVGTRAFAASTYLWRRVPEDNPYESLIWSYLIKYRKYPLKIFSSKLKLKIGALLSIFGERVLRFFISNK